MPDNASLPRAVRPAVYKYKLGGTVYYRLGISPEEGRRRLAKEKRVEPSQIEILDGGKKQ